MLAKSFLARLCVRLFSGHTEETEFLPAALEIVAQPPSPASRLIAGSIMLFFLLALLWACVGKVDIIATAPGKIIPTGKTKVIQPFDSGVIRAIHVQDGQHVALRDMLIEIDTTSSSAERDRLENDAMQAMLEALTLTGRPDADFIPPQQAKATEIALQKTLLLSQVSGIRAKLHGIDQQIAQSEGNQAAVAATIAKLAESIPYLEKRVMARARLAEKGYGSKLEYLTVQQDLIEHRQELKVQIGRLAEAKAAIATHRQERNQVEYEYRQTTLKDLTEAERKAASLNQQLVQASEKYRLQTLKSPVSGTVQQLAVHTEGGVVTPAQALLSIVPDTSRLEIEAMVSNQDIGFVHAGQEAEIKIDTFNFTRYGLLHGKVQSVSHDTITQDRAATAGDKENNRSESDTGETSGQKLIYSARVTLDKTQMRVDGRLVALSPGMAVTVEIKTGSRRVIDYLLSPLLRHQQEAFREM